MRRKPISFGSDRAGAEEFLLIVLLLLLGAMSNMVHGQRVLKTDMITLKANDAMRVSDPNIKQDTLYIVLAQNGAQGGTQYRFPEGSTRAWSGDICEPDAHETLLRRMREDSEWKPEQLVRVRVEALRSTPLCAWAQVHALTQALARETAGQYLALELAVQELPPEKETRP